MFKSLLQTIEEDFTTLLVTNAMFIKMVQTATQTIVSAAIIENISITKRTICSPKQVLNKYTFTLFIYRTD